MRDSAGTRVFAQRAEGDLAECDDRMAAGRVAPVHGVAVETNGTSDLSAMAFPSDLRTARLLLRSWGAADAAELLPILEANRAYISPWIPARVADPAPVPALAQRLAGFAAEFAAGREWRFAMFALDGGRLLGEIDLFPRNDTGRVALDAADRAELGYWLRRDAIGCGLVTEGARAVLAAAATIAQFSQVEIRCDARNAPSVAVARRLGFTQAAVPRASDKGDTQQVWISSLSPFGGPDLARSRHAAPSSGESSPQ